MDIFQPKCVTLEQMLAAREARQASQQRLQKEYGCSIVSFTMNIAGDVKYTPLIELAFSNGLNRIREEMGSPVFMEFVRAATGAEAILGYQRAAVELKHIAERIEAESPVNRLFDIDVLDTHGNKLSRARKRTCLVCGKSVGPCARSRAHGLSAVQDATRRLLADYAAEYLSQRAVCALIQEAHFTPKPGLVDENNTGAHRDMDLRMFEASAECLRPYFKRCVLVGIMETDCAYILREAGLNAEREMYRVTGGINTHKGSIFLFGILLGALGKSLVDGSDVFAHLKTLAAQLPRNDLHTHGSQVRARYGVCGAREEAENGMKNVLMACRVMEDKGELAALLSLMANCMDTNLLYRGEKKGLCFVQGWSRFILHCPTGLQPALARWLDGAMIRRNLSPGGCADLFALALFLCDIGLP